MPDIRKGLPDVAFFGGMGVGKTTAAKILSDLGWRHEKLFGSHPGGGRDIAARLWPNDPSVFEDRNRLLAVADAISAADANIWLHNLERHLDDPSRDDEYLGSPVVIDDCRRRAEFDALRARGFVMVRLWAIDFGALALDALSPAGRMQQEQNIRRQRLQQSGKYQNDEQFSHPLEHELDGERGDYEIINDGTVIDLEDEIVRIVNRETR